MSAMQNPNMPVKEKKPNQIQNRILEAALTTKSVLRIVMQNGTQYFGKLHDYDQFVLSLIPISPVGNGREPGLIMIYKSAIASLEMTPSMERVVTSRAIPKKQGQKQTQKKQESAPQLDVKSLEPELNNPEEETPNIEEIAKDAINDEANKLNERETEETEVTNETSSETEEQTSESVATEAFSFDEPEIMEETKVTDETSSETEVALSTEERPAETEAKTDESVVAEAFSFNEPEATEEAKVTEVTSTETQKTTKEENKEEKKDGLGSVLAELGI